MNFTINHLLTQDPHTLEVFADYLEEHPCAKQPYLHLFLRTRQHEEKSFSDGFDCKQGDGYCYGYGDGGGRGYGYGYVNGDGWGYDYSGRGDVHGYSDGYGVGDERNE
jgi:hypothetical protein